jgi:RNA polymerase sigma-70 factor (ECF subfamily)
MKNVEQIIQGCKAGQQRAQTALYNHFRAPMLAVCQRYVGPGDAAQDAMQLGFIKVFRYINQFAEHRIESLAGWIRRTMQNVCIDYLRATKRHSHLDLVADYALIDTRVEYDTDRDDETALMLQLVTQLPPGYQKIVRMHAIEGMTHKDIAKQLGIHEGTSKSNYFKAKAILREKFAEVEKKFQKD